MRGARREVREGDRVLIQEPGRVIIREGGRTIIRHNEVDRFRWQARDARVERHGTETVTVFERSDGSRIYTVTDESGRLLRRYRRASDGREIMIIDNRYSGPRIAAEVPVVARPVRVVAALDVAAEVPAAARPEMVAAALGVVGRAVVAAAAAAAFSRLRSAAAPAPRQTLRLTARR